MQEICKKYAKDIDINIFKHYNELNYHGEFRMAV